MTKLVPLPEFDLTSTAPPICSILLRTTSMPTPRPEMLVTAAAVEKPGAKMRLIDVGLRFRRYFGFADETGLDCLGIDTRSIEAAAVVGDFDHDVTALPRSAQANGAAARLARGAALERALDTVVGAIAHQMRERILD